MENANLIGWVLGGIFLLVNLAAFGVMLWDKNRARLNQERISEGDLFLFSICFGALGVFLGMFFARHKTLKVKFLIGIPLALIQNLALAWWLGGFLVF